MRIALYGKIKRIPLLISYHTDFISFLEERNLWYLSRTRGPILRWFYNSANSLLVPGHARPGGTSGRVTAFQDFMPTFLAAAGALQSVPSDVDWTSGRRALRWEADPGGRQVVGRLRSPGSLCLEP